MMISKKKKQQVREGFAYGEDNEKRRRIKRIL